MDRVFLKRLKELKNVVKLRNTIARPVVLFESDDWGKIGIRDREGFETLVRKGHDGGQRSIGCYSLETANDLESLYGILLMHSDSTGSFPIFTCNFVMANPDFKRIAASDFKEYYYIPLKKGLPDKWLRPRLFETYLKGINLGVIYPGYHGRDHFNFDIWLRVLRGGDCAATDAFEDQQICATKYRGLNPLKDEYYDGSTLPTGFRNYRTQRQIVQEGTASFKEAFGFTPLTTAAPSYVWNENTECAWADSGFRIIQSGNRYRAGLSSAGRVIYMRKRYFCETNRYNMIYFVRNVDFEPRGRNLDLIKILDEIDFRVQIGEPVIISSHSINYQSSIWNFRDTTLQQLDDLLTALEKRYRNILYLSDVQLAECILKGQYINTHGQKITLELKDHNRDRIKKYWLFVKHIIQK